MSLEILAARGSQGKSVRKHIDSTSVGVNFTEWLLHGLCPDSSVRYKMATSLPALPLKINIDISCL